MVHTATDASALLLLSSFSSVGFSFDPVGGSTGHISHGRLFFHDSFSISLSLSLPFCGACVKWSESRRPFTDGLEMALDKPMAAE